MKSVVFEQLINENGYQGSMEISKEQINEAISFVLKKIDGNLEPFTNQFPAPASCNQVYDAIDNTDWTASFWTGMLWLAYEQTNDQKYRDIAEIHLKSFKNRIDNKICVDTHDLGFLYSLACVSAYKLTGNETALDTALSAAEELITRYFDKAGIIQAWGDLSDPEQRGRMIIDCCMNLPLLYWATEKTGDSRYFEIASSHVKQAQTYLVREDASTFHTYYMDTESGKPKLGKTAQGFSDSSCWARGQAWGIYGFPLSYIHTKDASLLESASKLANYFINRLPEDYVCYWDLVFTEGTEERDSSGAAIAVCGLLELSKHLPESSEYKHIYHNVAMKILKSLMDNYTTATMPESNGILLHSVYAKPDGKGIDECCIWGDYFYFEALTRVQQDWELYW